MKSNKIYELKEDVIDILNNLLVNLDSFKTHDIIFEYVFEESVDYQKGYERIDNNINIKNILEAKTSLKEKLFIFNNFIIEEIKNINDFFNRNQIIKNEAIYGDIKENYERCFEDGVFDITYFDMGIYEIKYFDEEHPFCATIYIELLKDLLTKHLHKSNNCVDVYGLLDIPVKNESVAEGISKYGLPVTYYEGSTEIWIV